MEYCNSVIGGNEYIKACINKIKKVKNQNKRLKQSHSKNGDMNNEK